MSRPKQERDTAWKKHRSCTELSKTRKTRDKTRDKTCNSATADDADKAHDAGGAGGARGADIWRNPVSWGSCVTL